MMRLPSGASELYSYFESVDPEYPNMHRQKVADICRRWLQTAGRKTTSAEVLDVEEDLGSDWSNPDSSSAIGLV